MSEFDKPDEGIANFEKIINLESSDQKEEIIKTSNQSDMNTLGT